MTIKHCTIQDYLYNSQIPNTTKTQTMRNYYYIFLTLVLGLLLNACNTRNQKVKDNESPTVETIQYKNLEIPRTQVIPIKDTQSDRQYELYIKLPEGYSENNDIKYPVLYFTDAMWHFEILSGSTEYLMENIILVGISWQKDIKSTIPHISRFGDYTMTKSTNPEHQAKYQYGQASNHLNFIRNDVIKYVENNYQTDPNNRSYFGYSLGGSFGAYILFTQPNTFKNYILGSPTTLFDNSYIYEHESITTLKQKDLNANIFVSIGAMENEDMIEQAKGFIPMLKSKNYTNLSSKLEVIESADHSRAFPMTALRSMYWLSDFTK